MALDFTILKEIQHNSQGDPQHIYQQLCAHYQHDQTALLQDLAQILQYAATDLTFLYTIQPDFKRLSFQQCRQKKIILYENAEHHTQVVLSNPFMTDVMAWASAITEQSRIFLVTETDLDTYLSWCEEKIKAFDTLTDHHQTPTTAHDNILDLSLSNVTKDQNFVIKAVNTILYDALKAKASDIHLESTEHGTIVRYRLDGILQTVTRIDGIHTSEQIISRLKVIAELDTSETRIPQDGRFSVTLYGRSVDFRVSIIPSLWGEDSVLRLLDRSYLSPQTTQISLTGIGISTDIHAVLQHIIRQPHGLLLVTGPTGSGKTTTLYAALMDSYSETKKIITIEDPVEYHLPGILQIPVNEKKGLSFAKGLRSILRHDPDTIMVGEIRDQETAQIAIQAALTGHLVFTTVHANSMFDVVGRFLHMGLDSFSLATACSAIYNQRLVRILCPHCKAPAHYTDAEKQYLSPYFLQHTQHMMLYRATGCEHCRMLGYQERRVIGEILVLDDEMRDMISQKLPVARMKKYAQQKGISQIQDYALSYLERGETTLEEVSRVIS